MLARHTDQRGHPLGKVVKALAAGVGLASETISHQKGKKLSKQRINDEDLGLEASQGSNSMVEINRSEEACQLDEPLEELTQEHALRSPSEDIALLPDNSTLADSFMQIHQPPPYSRLVPPARLELPIIVTQRRPKDRTRGFIRAYAPMLQNVGIDQQTFLDFIDHLNKAVEPSPWIQAINLASFAAQHVPEPVTLAVSIACKMVADAASSAHSRLKTNSFLDKINEEYFNSRGLIALLVTWKPNDPSIVTDFSSNLGSTVSNASSSLQGSTKYWKHRMQSSSGASSFEFPETAPLVFPEPDELARHTSNDAAPEAKKESALKRGGAFLADYQDRRAVAEWAGANPDSKVANAAPQPEFRSRYSDPNHPASSGDLLAFVTGGKISAGALRQPQRTASGSIIDTVRAGRRDQVAPMASRRRELMQTRRSTEAPGVGKVITGVKGLLQKDVLYLLIVNRPSEQEIEEAVALVYGNGENARGNPMQDLGR